MQCRTLSVGHSAWPVRLLCCLILLALLSAASVGAIVPWWLQCGWLPVFYYSFAAIQPSKRGWVLSFDCGLQIRSDALDSAQAWSAQKEPATLLLEQGGELLADSRQCWLGFWLHWCSSDGKLKRRWLFQDAFSAADVRALARHIQQLRWQQPAAPAGLMQWFS